MTIAQEIERHYKHNFTVNVLDGASFWLGYSFITPTTILPLYVSHLTHNPFLIGLIPMLSGACYLLPQLFTSNWVQRSPLKKVFPVKYGFFAERLPVFLMAPTTLLLAVRSPGLALVIFFLLFAWHAAGAGLIAVGWQDMVAKIIPANRRGLFFGLTQFGGMFTGVIGASGVAIALNRYPFPLGYALSFGAASLFILISWFFIAATREPPLYSQTEAVSQWEYLRSLPAIMRRDLNFQRYLTSQVVGAFGGMGIGFLTVYAVTHWQLPDSQGGNYTAAMMIGQAFANLLFGPLADRKGYKLVMEISIALGVLSFVIATFAPNPLWFYAVFALRGAANGGGMMSGVMIALEFSAPEMRPTYIGLSNTIYGIAAAIAPLAGSWLAETTGYGWLFGLSAASALAGLTLLHWLVREPRLVEKRW